MGKVLPVGGIHAKIRAAYEAGVKEVLLPADKVKDTADLPQYVKDAVKLFPVNSLDQVIAKALLAAPEGCDAGDALRAPRWKRNGRDQAFGPFGSPPWTRF